MTIRSYNDYIRRYYPDGKCRQRMTIGFRSTRIFMDCGAKGYHVIDGEWRCCEHGGCEKACAMKEMIGRIFARVTPEKPRRAVK